jgi:hypothetical protein
METFQTIIAVFIVFAAFWYILKTLFSKKEKNSPCSGCQCSCSAGCEHGINLKNINEIKTKKP